MFTGIQLRLLRQANGMMQKELADIMDLAQQRISALEKTKEKNTDDCSNRVLAALKFSKEEAIRFLNTLPSSTGTVITEH